MRIEESLSHISNRFSIVLSYVVELILFLKFLGLAQCLTKGQLIFRKKSFMLDQMTQRNASKFVIFIEYKTSYYDMICYVVVCVVV